MSYFGLKISKKTSALLSLAVVGAFIVIFVVFNQKIEDTSTGLMGASGNGLVVLETPFEPSAVPVEPRYFSLIPQGVASAEWSKGSAGLAFELEKGAAVLAAAGGVVESVEPSLTYPSAFLITVNHTNDGGPTYISYYDQVADPAVEAGAVVKKGERLGRSGLEYPDGETAQFIFGLRSENSDICPKPYLSDLAVSQFSRMLNHSVKPDGGTYKEICYSDSLPGEEVE